MKIIELESITKRYKVGLVYLFGSMQKIGHELLSQEVSIEAAPEVFQTDIDIGVVFIEFPREEIRYIYGRLYEDLTPLFSPYKLDLIFLQEVDYLLQWEVINGVNVYKVNEDFFDCYEEKVMKFAADWKYEYDLFQKEFLEGMRSGYRQFEYNPDKG
ncbi:MAG: nucleotidyltransferase domain-containing protein [bacterium]